MQAIGYFRQKLQLINQNKSGIQVIQVPVIKYQMIY